MHSRAVLIARESRPYCRLAFSVLALFLSAVKAALSIVNNAGDHGGEAIPVPIPNTEVKLPGVDDSAARCESRQLPAFYILVAVLPRTLNPWKPAG